MSARRGTALLKERLPCRWRCNVPAIRTLQANMESQKHTALQCEATLRNSGRRLIKIHCNLLQPLFQETLLPGSHILTTHIQMTNTLVISTSEKHSFIRLEPNCAPLDHFSLCPVTAGLATSIYRQPGMKLMESAKTYC